MKATVNAVPLINTINAFLHITDGGNSIVTFRVAYGSCDMHCGEELASDTLPCCGSYDAGDIVDGTCQITLYELHQYLCAAQVTWKFEESHRVTLEEIHRGGVQKVRLSNSRDAFRLMG
jgi:hypothetical protein